VLALRTRKARHHGTCCLCPAPVITGQRIGLLLLAGWAHVPCIVTAQRRERDQLRVLMTTPPQPSERNRQDDQ
jgi:hypothetical protein